MLGGSQAFASQEADDSRIRYLLNFFHSANRRKCVGWELLRTARQILRGRL